MNVEFTVDQIALHRMDKDAKGANTLEKATDTVNLDAFQQEDRAAIELFFSEHLRRIWDALEGSNSISAATFSEHSAIQKDYQELVAKSDREIVVPIIDQEPGANGDKAVAPGSYKLRVPNNEHFLTCSRRMADSLFAEAPTNSSPGILLTLWFRKNDDKSRRQFLALLKMDPGRSNKVALRLHGQEVLLDLAVQHIDQALPETGDRVLKWAVTPHPTRSYDVKVRDSQGKQKAIYFMKFLGCEAGKTEKEQVRQVVELLPPAAVGKLITKTKTSPRVDLGVIRESKALTKPQLSQVENTFPKEFDISSKALQTLKQTFKLDNGIIIKGPYGAMNDVHIVDIVKLAKNDFEFRIRTTHYEKSYD